MTTWVGKCARTSVTRERRVVAVLSRAADRNKERARRREKESLAGRLARDWANECATYCAGRQQHGGRHPTPRERVSPLPAVLLPLTLPRVGSYMPPPRFTATHIHEFIASDATATQPRTYNLIQPNNQVQIKTIFYF